MGHPAFVAGDGKATAGATSREEADSLRGMTDRKARATARAEADATARTGLAFVVSHPSQVRDGWGTRHLWLGMGGQRQGQRQMQGQERGWLLRFPTLGTRTRMCRGWGTRTSLVLAGKRARLVPGSWVLLGPSGLCSRRFPRGCRLPLLRRRRRRSGWPGRCIR